MRPAIGLSALVLIVACHAGSDPEAELAGPMLKAAGRPADTSKRANLVWADAVSVDGSIVPSGIRGDGRLKDGSAATGSPPNEYQGNYCGVQAFESPVPDLNYKPDGLYGNLTAAQKAVCGPARFYNFYLGGPSTAPTVGFSHSIARGLWSLAPGQSAVQWEGFGSICGGKLMYNDSTRYAPSNSLLQTRLPDVAGVRQWRIESRGTHMGVCVTYNKNGSVKSVGPGLFMPFSLTVTEVPSPFPTFP